MYRDTPIGILDENWQPVAPDDPAYLAWLAEGNTPEILGRLSPAEEMILVRSQRDRLLRESDWTQLASTPYSAGQRQLWERYRQQLRDIPQKFAQPELVIWPTPPAEVKIKQAGLADSRPALLNDKLDSPTDKLDWRTL